MSIFDKLFSGGISKAADSIGGAIDKIFTNDEERKQLDNEIRKAEMEHQVELSKLTVEEKRLYYGDVDSARKREMAVATSPETPWYVKAVGPLLAVLGTLLCFTLFYILVFKKNAIDEGAKQIVIYILGVLSAILTQVYSYYFGSSQGSAEKGKTLAGQLEHKN